MVKVKPNLCVKQLVVSDLVVCGASYLTRAVLSCHIMPHKQIRWNTISCSTHLCGFPIIQYNVAAIMIHCNHGDSHPRHSIGNTNDYIQTSMYTAQLCCH